MQNPFLKPDTVPQWLLSSICWVGSCLAGFVGCSRGAFALSNEYLVILFVFGSAIAVCVLMWRRVISTGWWLIGRGNGETLTIKLVENMAVVWLALLFLAFVISVGLIAFGLLMCLALAGESQGGGWQ
jgi:hypothetical protein